MQDHRQLEVWQRAMSYAVDLYRCSDELPSDERYNLARQLRRAALSVPLNIAEGCGCDTPSEFARFLGIAYRSLKEVVTCLELWQRLYPDAPRTVISPLEDEGNQLSRMTYTLIQRVKTTGARRTPGPTTR